MGILKEEDILLIKKHADIVNYGSVTLDFQNGVLLKVEHQAAELTRAGSLKRGNRREGRN